MTRGGAVRQLELEGCLNVRDVGGYPTAGGRVTRTHRLLRGDCLHDIGTAGWEALVADGVSTVIDLRSEVEVERDPADPPAELPITRHHLPVFGHDDPFDGAGLDTLAAMYLVWLDQRTTRMARIMRAIASAPAPSVLVHCWSGKDRTGVVIALLLLLAGVEPELVAADYALTSDLLEPRVTEWRAKLIERGEDVARFDRIVPARAATMLEVCQHIERDHGGAEGYLRSLELTSPEVDSLRALLLAPEWPLPPVPHVR
jgi:protein-tyrosine phosphatase